MLRKGEDARKMFVRTTVERGSEISLPVVPSRSLPTYPLTQQCG
jgi:hypothetical protein